MEMGSNWIKIKDTYDGLHEITVESIVDFYFDSKNHNWVMVLNNKNGIRISPALHDDIIKVIETLPGNGKVKDLTVTSNEISEQSNIQQNASGNKEDVK